MERCQMEYWRKNNVVKAEEELTAILTKEIKKQIISDMEKKIYTKAKCSGNLEAVMGKVALCGPNTAPKKIHRQYRPVDDNDLEAFDVCADKKPSKKNKNNKQANKFVSNNYGDPFNFLKYLNNDKNGFNL